MILRNERYLLRGFYTRMNISPKMIYFRKDFQRNILQQLLRRGNFGLFWMNRLNSAEFLNIVVNPPLLEIICVLIIYLYLHIVLRVLPWPWCQPFFTKFLVDGECCSNWRKKVTQVCYYFLKFRRNIILSQSFPKRCPLSLLLQNKRW